MLSGALMHPKSVNEKADGVVVLTFFLERKSRHGFRWRRWNFFLKSFRKKTELLLCSKEVFYRSLPPCPPLSFPVTELSHYPFIDPETSRTFLFSTFREWSSAPWRKNIMVTEKSKANKSRRSPKLIHAKRN